MSENNLASAPPNAVESGNRIDVAIVGAGPMGSFAAERMAREGLAVTLFEKDAHPGDSTVCAGGMHQDLVRFLDLPPDLIEKTLPALRLEINGRVTEWRFNLPTYATVQRRRLDAFLAQRAVQAGVRLVTSARVVTVDRESGELHYELGPERIRTTANARVIVFADGPRSLSHHILGESNGSREPVEYVGIEVDLEAPSNRHEALEIIPDAATLPFGYLWVFPKSDHINVGLARLGSIKGPPLADLLDRFIEQREDLRGLRVLRRKGGVIPARRGPVLHEGNCLVIGDAAGMINPLTGGGYVCGFVSAALAAGVCAQAFQGGRFRPKVLSRYPRRLRRTKHYLTIRAGEALMDCMLAVYRRFGTPLYLSLLRLYFHAVHAAMRFVRVI